MRFLSSSNEEFLRPLLGGQLFGVGQSLSGCIYCHTEGLISARIALLDLVNHVVKFPNHYLHIFLQKVFILSTEVSSEEGETSSGL